MNLEKIIKESVREAIGQEVIIDFEYMQSELNSAKEAVETQNYDEAYNALISLVGDVQYAADQCNSLIEEEY